MFSACLQYLLGLKPASLVFTTYLPTKYPALTREGIGRYRGTIICEVDRFKGVMSIGQYTSSYSIHAVASRLVRMYERNEQKESYSALCTCFLRTFTAAAAICYTWFFRSTFACFLSKICRPGLVGLGWLVGSRGIGSDLSISLFYRSAIMLLSEW